MTAPARPSGRVVRRLRTAVVGAVGATGVILASLTGTAGTTAYAGTPTSGALTAAAASGIPAGDAATTPGLTPATDNTDNPDTGILQLGSITPTVAGPGQPVTITGTVTARQRALADPTVRVVVSPTAIVGRADVASWTDDAQTTVTGTEVGSATIGAPVAQGASAPFSITVPAGRLTLARSWGVVPIALEVTDGAGSDTDRAANHEVVRTFTGWQRAKQYVPVQLAVVAPVTLSPDGALFGGTLESRLAAWQAQLAPGGRLQRILDGTDVDGPTGPVPVTWAVDPAVLGPPAASVSTSGASGASGGSAAAAAGNPFSPLTVPVTTRLATGAGRHTLWALPYADTDVAASAATDPGNAIVAGQVAASATLSSTLGVTTRTGVAWPADGGLPQGREDALRTVYSRVGLSSVLVSSSSLPTATGTTGTGARLSPEGTPLLAWDDELSRLTLQTSSAAQGALTTQRFLAETATLLGERPGLARSFVVAMPRQLDPDAGALKNLLGTLASVPWVSFTTTDTLLQQAGTQDKAAASAQGAWTEGGSSPVDASLLSLLAKGQQTTDTVASVLAEGGPAYRSRWNDLVDQLTSTRWRTDATPVPALVADLEQAGVQATSGIHVSGQTTNFLADEGVLQVTVVNDLAAPVDDVRLLLTPRTPRLRVVEQPAPFRIEGSSRAVVQVRVQAVAAGLVPVAASLTTGNGTPIGAGATLTVRANPPSPGFYIVSLVVLALLFVGGLIRTLRRGRKGKRGLRASSDGSGQGDESDRSDVPVAAGSESEPGPALGSAPGSSTP